MLEQKSYKVLATKYRPKDFDALVGQDVLVRTLTNSINNNRIANAFVLTGIRGVGKTTTARIIARALNCIGPDGAGGPTIKPCGICSNCVSIASDRHPDVIEMDAASRTGIDDIREVIDNTHYKPIAARYKVYIIDEVHMLSKNAFNALLKTLEEPPSHVKFIFATTEIRKIPITILSRCMRFDLKRIDGVELAVHLGKIAEKENVIIQKEALAVITANAEGSVRDALSLFDQVIANADGEITVQLVRNVLGLSDKSRIIELFSSLARGDITESFALFEGLYKDGGDPVLVFNDLLEFTYLVSRMNVAPVLSPDASVPQEEVLAATQLAEKLDVSYLTRLWQVLLKGLAEIKIAPDSYAASEMIMIRIAYMSGLPTPATIISDLSKLLPGNEGKNEEKQEDRVGLGVVSKEVVSTITTAALGNVFPSPSSFIELVELFKNNGEILLYNWLNSNVRLVKFEKGRVEISLCASLPSDFAGNVMQLLKKWTQEHWVVVISKQQGAITIQESNQLAVDNLKTEISKHQEVHKILEMFPGAVIEKVEN